jgi:hypothetical protein
MSYALKKSLCFNSTRLVPSPSLSFAIAYSLPRQDDSSNRIQIGHVLTFKTRPMQSVIALPQRQLGGRRISKTPRLVSFKSSAKPE